MLGDVCRSAVALTVLMLALIGCDQRPSASTPAPSVPGDASAATRPAGEPAPAGVDDRDDPEAPRAFPRTGEVGGWVKVEPVRVRPGEAIREIVADEPLLALLDSYQLRRGARAAYERQKVRAEVFLVEALQPADAFGLLSVLGGEHRTFVPADGSLRAASTGGERDVFAAWQGDTFLEVSCTAGDASGSHVEKCEQLFNRIVFSVPRADPPLLMRAIPVDRRGAARVWLVRSTSVLARLDVPVLGAIDPEVMDERLGLSGEPTLSIAAIHVAPDEPDNVIWLATYPDQAMAREAHDRYRRALEANDDAVDRQTIIYTPRDVHLIGSWTAGQESVQNLLPYLHAELAE